MKFVMNVLLEQPMVTTTIIIFTTYFIYWYKKTYSFWSSRGIKGPTPLPIVGNALTYIFNPISDIDVRYAAKYGKTYGIYQGTEPVLINSDPDIVERIYNTNHSSFRLHIKPPTEDPMVVQSIVFQKGLSPEWKRARAIFTSGLTPSKLKESFDVAIKNQDLMKYMKNNEEKEMNGIELFTVYTLNTVIRTYFGLDFDLFNHVDHEIVFHCRHLVADFNIFRFFLSKFAPSFLVKSSGTIPATYYLADVAEHAIKEREKEMENSKDFKPRSDYLQLIMDSSMSRIEKLSNLSFQLFQASTDTIPLVIAYLLDELGRRQCIMKRLQEEIDAVVCVQDSDVDMSKTREVSELSFEEVQSLKYLEWCLLETLRLRPTASRSFRRSSEETKIPTTNITIPANVSINTAVIPLHHDPDSYENPKQFIPDRWSDEKKMKKGSFVAFGVGPRQCPARQFSLVHAKIAVINILSKYDVEVPHEADELKLSPGNYVYETPNWIKFIPRK